MEKVISYIEFEVLTAVVMKSTIFWYITPCSPLKANRRFGRTYCLQVASRAVLSFPPAFALVSCSAYSWTLKMEAICSYQTSVGFQRTTRRYITKDCTLQFICVLLNTGNILKGEILKYEKNLMLYISVLNFVLVMKVTRVVCASSHNFNTSVLLFIFIFLLFVSGALVFNPASGFDEDVPVNRSSVSRWSAWLLVRNYLCWLFTSLLFL
jgi:hypothetical protein